MGTVCCGQYQVDKDRPVTRHHSLDKVLNRPPHPKASHIFLLELLAYPFIYMYRDSSRFILHQQPNFPFIRYSRNPFLVCEEIKRSTSKIDMGFRLSSILHAKQFLNHESLSVPKGYCAVYAGECQKRRFVIPITFLNHPSFQELLTEAEEEFGFHHSMGGLTIPCKDEILVDLLSRFGESL